LYARSILKTKNKNITSVFSKAYSFEEEVKRASNRELDQFSKNFILNKVATQTESSSINLRIND
jgi:hypothetical protein